MAEAHGALIDPERGVAFAFASAGTMAQNVDRFCASEGLGAVIRAWFNRKALAEAMGLRAEQQLLLSQTVGVLS